MGGMGDYYRLLGLNPGASEEEIKEAYRRMIKVWDAERFPNDPKMQKMVNERLKEIDEAYKNLLLSHTGYYSQEKETLESQPQGGGKETNSIRGVGVQAESQELTAKEEISSRAEVSHDPAYPPDWDDPNEPLSESERRPSTRMSHGGHGGPQLSSIRPFNQGVIKSVYAGFWNRFAAVFIDGVVVGVGALILCSPFSIARGLSTVKSYPFWVITDSVLSLLIGWLYCTLLESSSKQGTIGKMAVGIVVTDLAGNRISFGRANGRWWGKTISSLILGIGLIMAGFTQKKQALHDIMADTLVVRKPEGVRKWVTAIPVIASGIIALGVIGLIYLEMKPLTTEQSDPPFTDSAPPSSVNPSSTTPSKDSISKGDPFLTYLRKKERGELPPLLADIDKTPLPPGGQSQPIAGWKSYAVSPFGSHFYKTEGLSRPANNVVRVWTQKVYTEGGITDFVERHGERYKNVGYSINLFEINCEDKQLRLLSGADYTRTGMVLENYNYPGGEWQFITPKSVGDYLCKEVCK